MTVSRPLQFGEETSFALPTQTPSPPNGTSVPTLPFDLFGNSNPTPPQTNTRDPFQGLENFRFPSSAPQTPNAEPSENQEGFLNSFLAATWSGNEIVSSFSEIRSEIAAGRDEIQRGSYGVLGQDLLVEEEPLHGILSDSEARTILSRHARSFRDGLITPQTAEEFIRANLTWIESHHELWLFGAEIESRLNQCLWALTHNDASRRQDQAYVSNLPQLRERVFESARHLSAQIPAWRERIVHRKEEETQRLYQNLNSSTHGSLNTVERLRTLWRVFHLRKSQGASGEEQARLLSEITQLLPETAALQPNSPQHLGSEDESAVLWFLAQAETEVFTRTDLNENAEASLRGNLLFQILPRLAERAKNLERSQPQLALSLWSQIQRSLYHPRLANASMINNWEARHGEPRRELYFLERRLSETQSLPENPVARVQHWISLAESAKGRQDSLAALRFLNQAEQNLLRLENPETRRLSRGVLVHAYLRFGFHSELQGLLQGWRQRSSPASIARNLSGFEEWISIAQIFVENHRNSEAQEIFNQARGSLAHWDLRRRIAAYPALLQLARRIENTNAPQEILDTALEDLNQAPAFRNIQERMSLIVGLAQAVSTPQEAFNLLEAFLPATQLRGFEIHSETDLQVAQSYSAQLLNLWNRIEDGATRHSIANRLRDFFNQTRVVRGNLSAENFHTLQRNFLQNRILLETQARALSIEGISNSHTELSNFLLALPLQERVTHLIESTRFFAEHGKETESALLLRALWNDLENTPLEQRFTLIQQISHLRTSLSANLRESIRREPEEERALQDLVENLKQMAIDAWRSIQNSANSSAASNRPCLLSRYAQAMIEVEEGNEPEALRLLQSLLRDSEHTPLESEQDRRIVVLARLMIRGSASQHFESVALILEQVLEARQAGAVEMNRLERFREKTELLNILRAIRQFQHRHSEGTAALTFREAFTQFQSDPHHQAEAQYFIEHISHLGGIETPSLMLPQGALWDFLVAADGNLQSQEGRQAFEQAIRNFTRFDADYFQTGEYQQALHTAIEILRSRSSAEEIWHLNTLPGWVAGNEETGAFVRRLFSWETGLALTGMILAGAAGGMAQGWVIQMLEQGYMGETMIFEGFEALQWARMGISINNTVRAAQFVPQFFGAFGNIGGFWFGSGTWDTAFQTGGFNDIRATAVDIGPMGILLAPFATWGAIPRCLISSLVMPLTGTARHYLNLTHEGETLEHTWNVFEFLHGMAIGLGSEAVSHFNAHAQGGSPEHQSLHHQREQAERIHRLVEQLSGTSHLQDLPPTPSFVRRGEGEVETSPSHPYRSAASTEATAKTDSQATGHTDPHLKILQALHRLSEQIPLHELSDAQIRYAIREALKAEEAHAGRNPETAEHANPFPEILHRYLEALRRGVRPEDLSRFSDFEHPFEDLIREARIRNASREREQALFAEFIHLERLQEEAAQRQIAEDRALFTSIDFEALKRLHIEEQRARMIAGLAPDATTLERVLHAANEWRNKYQGQIPLERVFEAFGIDLETLPRLEIFDTEGEVVSETREAFGEDEVQETSEGWVENPPQSPFHKGGRQGILESSPPFRKGGAGGILESSSPLQLEAQNLTIEDAEGYVSGEVVTLNEGVEDHNTPHPPSFDMLRTGLILRGGVPPQHDTSSSVIPRLDRGIHSSNQPLTTPTLAKTSLGAEVPSEVLSFREAKREQQREIQEDLLDVEGIEVEAEVSLESEPGEGRSQSSQEFHEDSFTPTANDPVTQAPLDGIRHSLRSFFEAHPIVAAAAGLIFTLGLRYLFGQVHAGISEAGGILDWVLAGNAAALINAIAKNKKAMGDAYVAVLGSDNPTQITAALKILPKVSEHLTNDQIETTARHLHRLASNAEHQAQVKRALERASDKLKSKITSLSHPVTHPSTPKAPKSLFVDLHQASLIRFPGFTVGSAEEVRQNILGLLGTDPLTARLTPLIRADFDRLSRVRTSADADLVERVEFVFAHYALRVKFGAIPGKTTSLFAEQIALRYELSTEDGQDAFYDRRVRGAFVDNNTPGHRPAPVVYTPEAEVIMTRVEALLREHDSLEGTREELLAPWREHQDLLDDLALYQMLELLGRISGVFIRIENAERLLVPIAEGQTAGSRDVLNRALGTRSAASIPVLEVWLPVSDIEFGNRVEKKESGIARLLETRAAFLGASVLLVAQVPNATILRIAPVSLSSDILHAQVGKDAFELVPLGRSARAKEVTRLNTLRLRPHWIVRFYSPFGDAGGVLVHPSIQGPFHEGHHQHSLSLRTGRIFHVLTPVHARVSRRYAGIELLADHIQELGDLDANPLEYRGAKGLARWLFRIITATSSERYLTIQALFEDYLHQLALMHFENAEDEAIQQTMLAVLVDHLNLLRDERGLQEVDLPERRSITILEPRESERAPWREIQNEALQTSTPAAIDAARNLAEHANAILALEMGTEVIRSLLIRALRAKSASEYEVEAACVAALKTYENLGIREITEFSQQFRRHLGYTPSAQTLTIAETAVAGTTRSTDRHGPARRVPAYRLGRPALEHRVWNITETTPSRFSNFSDYTESFVQEGLEELRRPAEEVVLAPQHLETFRAAIHDLEARRIFQEEADRRIVECLRRDYVEALESLKDKHIRVRRMTLQEYREEIQRNGGTVPAYLIAYLEEAPERRNLEVVRVEWDARLTPTEELNRYGLPLLSASMTQAARALELRLSDLSGSPHSSYLVILPDEMIMHREYNRGIRPVRRVSVAHPTAQSELVPLRERNAWAQIFQTCLYDVHGSKVHPTVGVIHDRYLHPMIIEEVPEAQQEDVLPIYKVMHATHLFNAKELGIVLELQTPDVYDLFTRILRRLDQSHAIVNTALTAFGEPPPAFPHPEQVEAIHRNLIATTVDHPRQRELLATFERACRDYAVPGYTSAVPGPANPADNNASRISAATRNTDHRGPAHRLDRPGHIDGVRRTTETTPSPFSTVQQGTQNVHNAPHPPSFDMLRTGLILRGGEANDNATPWGHPPLAPAMPVLDIAAGDGFTQAHSPYTPNAALVHEGTQAGVLQFRTRENADRPRAATRDPKASGDTTKGNAHSSGQGSGQQKQSGRHRANPPGPQTHTRNVQRDIAALHRDVDRVYAYLLEWFRIPGEFDLRQDLPDLARHIAETWPEEKIQIQIATGIMGTEHAAFPQMLEHLRRARETEAAPSSAPSIILDLGPIAPANSAVLREVLHAPAQTLTAPARVPLLARHGGGLKIALEQALPAPLRAEARPLVEAIFLDAQATDEPSHRYTQAIHAWVTRFRHALRSALHDPERIVAYLEGRRGVLTPEDRIEIPQVLLYLVGDLTRVSDAELSPLPIDPETLRRDFETAVLAREGEQTAYVLMQTLYGHESMDAVDAHFGGNTSPRHRTFQAVRDFFRALYGPHLRKLRTESVEEKPAAAIEEVAAEDRTIPAPATTTPRHRPFRALLARLDKTGTATAQESHRLYVSSKLPGTNGHSYRTLRTVSETAMLARLSEMLETDPALAKLEGGIVDDAFDRAYTTYDLSTQDFQAHAVRVFEEMVRAALPAPEERSDVPSQPPPPPAVAVVAERSPTLPPPPLPAALEPVVTRAEEVSRIHSPVPPERDSSIRRVAATATHASYAIVYLQEGESIPAGIKRALTVVPDPVRRVQIETSASRREMGQWPNFRPEMERALTSRAGLLEISIIRSDGSALVIKRTAKGVKRVRRSAPRRPWLEPADAQSRQTRMRLAISGIWREPTQVRGNIIGTGEGQINHLSDLLRRAPQILHLANFPQVLARLEAVAPGLFNISLLMKYVNNPEVSPELPRLQAFARVLEVDVRDLMYLASRPHLAETPQLRELVLADPAGPYYAPRLWGTFAKVAEAVREKPLATGFALRLLRFISSPERPTHTLGDVCTAIGFPEISGQHRLLRGSDPSYLAVEKFSELSGEPIAEILEDLNRQHEAPIRTLREAGYPTHAALSVLRPNPTSRNFDSPEKLREFAKRVAAHDHSPRFRAAYLVSYRRGRRWPQLTLAEVAGRRHVKPDVLGDFESTREIEKLNPYFTRANIHTWIDYLLFLETPLEEIVWAFTPTAESAEMIGQWLQERNIYPELATAVLARAKELKQANSPAPESTLATVSVTEPVKPQQDFGVLYATERDRQALLPTLHEGEADLPVLGNEPALVRVILEPEEAFVEALGRGLNRISDEKIDVVIETDLHASLALPSRTHDTVVGHMSAHPSVRRVAFRRIDGSAFVWNRRALRIEREEHPPTARAWNFPERVLPEQRQRLIVRSPWAIPPLVLGREIHPLPSENTLSCVGDLLLHWRKALDISQKEAAARLSKVSADRTQYDQAAWNLLETRVVRSTLHKPQVLRDLALLLHLPLGHVLYLFLLPLLRDPAVHRYCAERRRAGPLHLNPQTRVLRDLTAEGARAERALPLLMAEALGDPDRLLDSGDFAAGAGISIVTFLGIYEGKGVHTTGDRKMVYPTLDTLQRLAYAAGRFAEHLIEAVNTQRDLIRVIEQINARAAAPFQIPRSIHLDVHENTDARKLREYAAEFDAQNARHFFALYHFILRRTHFTEVSYRELEALWNMAPPQIEQFEALEYTSAKAKGVAYRADRIERWIAHSLRLHGKEEIIIWILGRDRNNLAQICNHLDAQGLYPNIVAALRPQIPPPLIRIEVVSERVKLSPPDEAELQTRIQAQRERLQRLPSLLDGEVDFPALGEHPSMTRILVEGGDYVSALDRAGRFIPDSTRQLFVEVDLSAERTRREILPTIGERHWPREIREMRVIALGGVAYVSDLTKPSEWQRAGVESRAWQAASPEGSHRLILKAAWAAPKTLYGLPLSLDTNASGAIRGLSDLLVEIRRRLGTPGRPLPQGELGRLIHATNDGPEPEGSQGMISKIEAGRTTDLPSLHFLAALARIAPGNSETNEQGLDPRDVEYIAMLPKLRDKKVRTAALASPEGPTYYGRTRGTFENLANDPAGSLGISWVVYRALRDIDRPFDVEAYAERSGMGRTSLGSLLGTTDQPTLATTDRLAYYLGWPRERLIVAINYQRGLMPLIDAINDAGFPMEYSLLIGSNRGGDVEELKRFVELGDQYPTDVRYRLALNHWVRRRQIYIDRTAGDLAEAWSLTPRQLEQLESPVWTGPYEGGIRFDAENLPRFIEHSLRLGRAHEEVAEDLSPTLERAEEMVAWLESEKVYPDLVRAIRAQIEAMQPSPLTQDCLTKTRRAPRAAANEPSPRNQNPEKKSAGAVDSQELRDKNFLRSLPRDGRAYAAIPIPERLAFEKEIFRIIREHPPEHPLALLAKEVLARTHWNLLMQGARRRIRRVREGTAIDAEDLAQEAAAALLKIAIPHFDPTLNNLFSTYLKAWIKQTQKRHVDDLARTIRTPVHLLEDVSEVRTLLREGKTDKQICAFLEITPDKLEKIKSQMYDNTTSADAPRRLGNSDDESDLYAVLSEADALNPEDQSEQDERRALVQKALDLLDPRQAEILRRRFWKEETLEEVSAHIPGQNTDSVTRERVRQLERKALQRLKSILITRFKVQPKNVLDLLAGRLPAIIVGFGGILGLNLLPANAGAQPLHDPTTQPSPSWMDTWTSPGHILLLAAVLTLIPTVATIARNFRNGQNPENPPPPSSSRRFGGLWRRD